MTGDVLINIFDTLDGARRFARLKLDAGYDVTVTGEAPGVSINQTVGAAATAVAIDDAAAKYVVLAYNPT